MPPLDPAQPVLAPHKAAAPSRATHHERIYALLRERITSGAWPPGFQLPFELQLAQDHGVSRMTMNKVLSQLTREGFLVRRKKLGTFVARPMAQAAVMAITDIEAEVAALGLSWRFVLHKRSLRNLDPQEAQALSLPEGSQAGEVLSLYGVHHAGDQPFCVEERLINLAPAPSARAVDFSQTAPGAWLLREIPWSSAEHRIRAVAASAGLARDLGLDPAAPCLEITRRTETGGQWVTLVRQTYPGDRHELIAQFGPGEGG